jgi:hypothetical protein
MDIHIVRNVVSVIAEWRWKERQQPNTGYAEGLEIVELLNKPLKVADTIGIAIRESFDVEFINDGIFKPEWVGGAAGASIHGAFSTN